jgi:hypothetical protein
MFKLIRFTKRPNYAEVDQPNPLRFQVYYEENGTLVPQTGKMKCRDFLNDVVSARKGVNFYIYGLDNNTIKTNEQYVWIRFYNLKQSFTHNWETWVKSMAEAACGEEIKTYKPSSVSVMMRIPAYFFDYTYRISLLTLLIRLSNYGKNFESLAQALNSGHEVEILHSRAKLVILQQQFNIPDELKEYWFYHNGTYNSKKEFPAYVKNSIIHNNGICSWSNNIEVKNAL